MDAAADAAYFEPWQVYRVTILWKHWQCTTPAQYAVSLLVLSTAACALGGLRALRARLTLARARPRAARRGPFAALGLPLVERAGAIGAKRVVAAPLDLAAERLALALLGGAQFAGGLLLMLACMSYNPGVFAAVVAGHTLGELWFDTAPLAAEAATEWDASAAAPEAFAAAWDAAGPRSYDSLVI